MEELPDGKMAAIQTSENCLPSIHVKTLSGFCIHFLVLWPMNMCSRILNSFCQLKESKTSMEQKCIIESGN